MVRFMADSVEGTQIPDTVMVPGYGVQPITLRAGYVGGSYERSSHDAAPVNVNIDVDGTHPSADVLDIETGDATPDTAPGWVKEHNAANTGFPAVLYCNRTVIHAVANALVAANLQVGKDYFWWIATLDGTDKVADMTGVVAMQAWGSSNFPGHNIDLSIVYDDAFKPSAPAPIPTPVPVPVPVPVPTPVPAPPPPPPHHDSYTVVSGDNLTAIAARFGVTVGDLVAWNHIADPNLIYPGEVLTVSGGPVNHPQALTHIVRPGENLTIIARNNGVSVQDIVNWNHLSNPNLIFPNQRLIVGWR